MSKQSIFDYEKLDVYQLELAFIGWVADLLKEVRKSGAVLLLLLVLLLLVLVLESGANKASVESLDVPWLGTP